MKNLRYLVKSYMQNNINNFIFKSLLCTLLCSCYPYGGSSDIIARKIYDDSDGVFQIEEYKLRKDDIYDFYIVPRALREIRIKNTHKNVSVLENISKSGSLVRTGNIRGGYYEESILTEDGLIIPKSDIEHNKLTDRAIARRYADGSIIPLKAR